MKQRIKIEIREDQEEELIVYAREDSPLLRRIESMLLGDSVILGYSDNEVYRLSPEEIVCFYIEGGTVYARTAERCFSVKERLFQLEERFCEDFLRVNQSCLLRVSEIARFESSIGGALTVIMKNGYRDYVSRRQLKAVKERLGMRK